MNTNSNTKKTLSQPSFFINSEQQVSEWDKMRNAQNNVIKIVDPTDCSRSEPSVKVHNNRVSVWRANRNEKESETEKRIRLDKERDAKSIQKKNRNQLESVTDHQLCLKKQAESKTAKRYIRDAEQTEEQRERRLDYEATNKRTRRNIRNLVENEETRDIRLDHEAKNKSATRFIRDIKETEEERETRLNYETVNKRTQRNIRNLVENEEIQEIRLDHEAKNKSATRFIRDIKETEQERQTRLDYETINKRTQRNTQNLVENEDAREIRLDHEAKNKTLARFVRDLEETEEERRTRLDSETIKTRSRRNTRNLLENEEIREIRLDDQAKNKAVSRYVRDIEATEEEHQTRLEYERINKRTQRYSTSLEETEEEHQTRLEYERINKRTQRYTTSLEETEEMRLIRFKKEAACKTNQRLMKDQLETYEECAQRLQLNNQRESVRSHKRCQNETEEEKNRRKLRKRNADLLRNMKDTISSEELWPKIPTNEIKYRCLNAFKEAMCNHVVDQTICAICACLHYKLESLKINIAKMPNQHLLYPIDEMPSCVIRLNVHIDSTTGNLQMSEQIQEYIVNATDSSVIINGMLLCQKAIDLATGCVDLCNKCHNYLTMNKLPPLSLNNLMWIGDVPQDLQQLTLSEEKLIALYRHSSCVIKLFSITGDPNMAQTALKGNVITFPQNVSDIAKSLPLSPNVLPDIIKIIFVGRTLPSKDHVRSILTVRREIIRKALIWLHKNNILYKHIDIDNLLINTLPMNDIPDCLWATISLVDESQSCNIERSGYVNNNENLNNMCLEGVVSLNTSALMDTSATAISSSHIRQHLKGRTNIINEKTTLNENIYLIPHGQHPANEYFNTSFLPGLYPTLFPYGMGGVENERRQPRVSYTKHIRHFLSYHDRRFEMNTSFIFVTFNILQRRTACAKARILVSRPYFSSQADEINQLTAAEVNIALNQIESNSYTHNLNPRLSVLLKQLKTVSGSVMGSNQSRANYRVELHSQIFFSGLPNIFITINPCDLHHPLVMKFAGVDLDIDNLIFDQMPKSQERAAIVAKYPVAVARFFNRLITTVLSTLINYNSNTHQPNQGGGILGEIDAYYGTVEESGRGALHLHMLLWLVNNKNPHELRELIMNQIFRENLIGYLEDIIKEDLAYFQNETSESDVSNIEKHNRNLISICSPIPSPNNPNFEEQKRLAIHTLASENQIHRHTSTCYKYLKGITTDNASCRLRYPKKIYDKTTIDLESGEIQMKRAHPMINNFNEWLLLACRCNMDIKFVWSAADTKALVYYISDYITKKNLSFHDSNSLIYQAVQKFEKNEQNITYKDALDKSRRLILRCFNTLASQQEISSVQVASYLMGWPDHYTSHTFINIYLIGIECYLEQCLTKLKKQKTNSTTNDSFSIDGLALNMFEQLHETDEYDDDQNESFELEMSINDDKYILCNKRIDYQLRPVELSHVCLYDFYSEYRKGKMKTSDKILLDIDSIPSSIRRRGRPPNDRWLFQTNHPQYASHLILRRSFNVVPVLIGPSIPRRDREDTMERYARAILTLFHPWRTVLDICDLDQSWCDAFKIREATFTAPSNKVINNIQLLHDCKKDRDSDLFQLVNQPLPSRPVNTSSPYNDGDIQDAEEILALLDESTHLDRLSLNEQSIEGDGVRAYMKREYLKLTLANIIRSQRFAYITDISGLPEFVFNDMESKSIEVKQNNALVRTSNEHDIQQIRMWQYNLKTQKEQMRRMLLYGSQERPTQKSVLEQRENDKQIAISSLDVFNNNFINTPVPILIQTDPFINISVPNFEKIFNLNKEQTKTFNIVRYHIERMIEYEISSELNRTKPDQLLMYIGGAGGCGKSRVTEAISAFMSHHNRLHTLRSLAPSSAAAVGINGLTIQSMLREGRRKSSINTILTQTDIATVETEWRNIQYCLIDEISMVGCHMLARFHKITTIAKHTESSIPFGGINMIFLGDFVQYPPVLDKPLYSNLLSPNETLHHTLNVTKEIEKRANVSERDIQCKVGRALWLQVNKIVFLTEQMRNRDPLFMDMQSRLRSGECNNADYEMLCTRVVSHENDIKSFREPPWNLATMLVFRNEVRTSINNYCVFDESKKNNELPMVVVANDRVRNVEIDNTDLRRFLLSIPDNKTEGLPGYLPMVVNMPVLITHNIATELHISNGSIGRLVRLVMDDENVCVNNDIGDPKFPNNTLYIRKPLYALVELLGCKLTSSLVDLQPMVVPILPEQKTIKVDLKSFISPAQKRLLNNKTSITITRTQLPIVPAYAMTTHKCQGKTLSCGIIDLVPPPYSKSDIANVYVPISRFTSRDTMAILRHFPQSVLNQKPHPDMIAELKRLQNLYEIDQKET